MTKEEKEFFEAALKWFAMEHVTVRDGYAFCHACSVGTDVSHGNDEGHEPDCLGQWAEKIMARRMQEEWEQDPLRQRQENLRQLRLAITSSEVTYRDIAHHNGKSAGWVGKCLRGDYPYTDGYMLPRWLVKTLEGFGFVVPEDLRS